MAGDPKRDRVLGVFRANVISDDATGNWRATAYRRLARHLPGTYLPAMGSIFQEVIALGLRNGTVDARQVGAPLALRITCVVLVGKDVLTSGDENALMSALHLVEDDRAEGRARVVPQACRSPASQKCRLEEARSLVSSVVSRARAKANETSLLRYLEGLGLSQERIRDEILRSLLAGHRTTGSAAAWIFHHLAVEPDLAKCLAEEADRLAGEDGEFDGGSLARGRQSRAFARTVLRLYAPVGPSSQTQVVPSLSSVVSTPGTVSAHEASLLPSPWQTHRGCRVQLDAFDPHRENGSKAPDSASAGPGAAVAIRLATIELQLLALMLAGSVQMHLTPDVPVQATKPYAPLLPPALALTARLQQGNKRFQTSAA